jgi:hypothetical protein
MNDLPIPGFLEAIRAAHGAKAKLLARENLRETFRGDLVWEGEVLIFGLQDHPTASICYAWEVDGEVTAVVAEGPVESAEDAVRGSIMAQMVRKYRP